MNAPMVPVLFADGEYVAIPASGHALELVTECAAGGFLAVCFCGQVRVRDTADEAAAALDAHIAEAVA